MLQPQSLHCSALQLQLLWLTEQPPAWHVLQQSAWHELQLCLPCCWLLPHPLLQKKLEQVIKKSGMGCQIGIILCLIVSVAPSLLTLAVAHPHPQATLVVLFVIAFHG